MFPEYRDLISVLKNEDKHFARLFEEHNELDHKFRICWKKSNSVHRKRLKT